jgi:hypothetical protein
MSVEGNNFAPPVPTTPYTLPELVPGPNCDGCVAATAVCPPIARVRQETSDFNADLMAVAGTPVHDRVLSSIFEYGPAELVRERDRAQAAIDNCLRAVELVHAIPQDSTGVTYIEPRPLVPTFGVQFVPEGMVPVASTEELEARGFAPALNEAGNRIVRIGVSDPGNADTGNVAFMRKNTTAASRTLRRFRESAIPQVPELPENIQALLEETVQTTVHNVLAQQNPSPRLPRRSQR